MPNTNIEQLIVNEAILKAQKFYSKDIAAFKKVLTLHTAVRVGSNIKYVNPSQEAVSTPNLHQMVDAIFSKLIELKATELRDSAMKDLVDMMFAEPKLPIHGETHESER